MFFFRWRARMKKIYFYKLGTFAFLLSCSCAPLIFYHMGEDQLLMDNYRLLLRCDHFKRRTWFRDWKLGGLHLSPYENNESKPYIFAAFYSHARDQSGLNFLNVRILIHRLLHHPRTKTRKGYGVTVIVPKDLPDNFRRILRKDGAELYFTDIWRQLQVPILSNTILRVIRLQEHWTKLMAVWNMTDYSRVALYDSDILILENVDGIFDPKYVKLRDQPEQYRENPSIPKELYPYVFAAAPDAYLSYHFRRMPFAFSGNEYFNEGFFITRPNPNWIKLTFHLLRDQCWLTTAVLQCSAAKPCTAEQAFLNLLFYRYGPFPWTVIDIKYNKNIPQDDDLNHGVYAVRGPLSDPSSVFWPGAVDKLCDLWDEAKLEMLKWSEANNPEGAELQRRFYHEPDLAKGKKDRKTYP